MKVIKVEILLRGPPLPTGYIDLKRTLKDIYSLFIFQAKLLTPIIFQQQRYHTDAHIHYPLCTTIPRNNSQRNELPLLFIEKRYMQLKTFSIRIYRGGV